MVSKRRTSGLGDSILGTTGISLDILRQVAGAIPVPGVSAVVGAALVVITVVQAINANREDCDTLIKTITELMLVIVVPLKGKDPKTFPEDLVDNLKRLSSDLFQITQDLRALQKANVFQKLANYTKISGKIKACSANLDWAVRHFQVQKSIADTISLFRLVDFARDALIETMPRAKLASHTSGRPGAPTKCFEGTRSEILKLIEEWATNPEKFTPGVFWLTGVAGIGKSSLAQSIAILASTGGYLGASYFFSRRGEAELSDPMKFFPTLAYELAGFRAEFAKYLGDALGGRTDVCYRNLQEQAEKLLIQPLRRLSATEYPILLVIDALDECQPDGIQAIISLLIASQTQVRFPFRILFTGRPEPHLLAAFDASINRREIILHNADLALVQSDIRLYLKAGLQAIATKYHMDEAWFSENELDRLVQDSRGLFVYSYTALCFIGDTHVRQPQRQLSTLLGNQTAGDNPYSILDKIYTEVITLALQCDSPNYVIKRFRDVIGFLAFRRDALSIKATNVLLGDGGPGSYVRVALENLASVVVLPRSDEGSPEIYHESFRDYVTSPTRCLNTVFISETVQEAHLATRCFLIMESLLERGIASNRSAPGSPRTTQTPIPEHLTYSCRYWAAHLSSSSTNESNLIRLLYDFASIRILWWLEVLSRLKALPSAIKALSDAKAWLVRSNCPEGLLALVHDAYRFTSAFMEPISSAPEHIYTSALPFCPRQTAFWSTYCAGAGSTIKVIREYPLEWSPCISTLHGCVGAVYTVVYAPDGSRLASGSNDGAVRIWDVASGVLVGTLRRHTEGVSAIAFSADNSRLASASMDSTVRVWDVATGISLATLQGHNEEVVTVVFSLDGSRLTSQARDNTVWMWDVASGASLATLQGDTWENPRTIAISPNGSQLASRSRIEPLCIRDIASGDLVATLEGDTANAHTLIFSPDGSRLASKSQDHKIYIWDIPSGALLATMKSETEMAYILFTPDSSRLASWPWLRGITSIWDAASGKSVARLRDTGDHITFSPDGSLLSGSEENVVRIWDVASEAPIAKLRGHTSGISATTFSPDGSRLASGSSDSTVRIWDVTPRAHASPLEDYTKSVNIIAFSPDGSYLASGSEDNIIRIWHVASGSLMTRLQGHTSIVDAIEFSPDSSQLASGSRDTSVRVWNIPSGAMATAFDGHTDRIYIVAYAMDSSRLASGSLDNTVRIWDVASGAMLVTLRGHTEPVVKNEPIDDDASPTPSLYVVATYFECFSSLTFSPDGAVLRLISPHGVFVLDAVTGSRCKARHSESGQQFTEGQVDDASLLLAELPPVFLSNYWLCSRKDARRICHIPAEYSAASGPLAFGNFVAIGCTNSQVLILDLSGIEF